MPLSRRGLPWWVNRNFPRAPAASFMEERCGRARAPSVDYQDNTLSHQEGGQNWTPISPLKGVKFRRRLTDRQPGDVVVFDGQNHMAIYAGNGGMYTAHHDGGKPFNRQPVSGFKGRARYFRYQDGSKAA